MRSSLKPYILAALLIFMHLFQFTALAEESAAVILDRCAARINNAPSITAQFTIAEGASPFSGILTMSRSRFKLITPEIEVWFNGKTQWSYLTSDNEVNITEPTAEELAETNPFRIIAEFNSRYKCRKLKAAPGFDNIELTPKDASAAITNARITISRSTGWPTAIQATFASGASTSIAISAVKTGNLIDGSAFDYDPKAHPDAETVDLR